jgi:hypothetical protein
MLNITHDQDQVYIGPFNVLLEKKLKEVIDNTKPPFPFLSIICLSITYEKYQDEIPT